MLKVTQWVRLASNLRPLSQVKRRPKKAKTHSWLWGGGSKGARAFCGSLPLKVGKGLKIGCERDSYVEPNIGPSLKLRTEMGLADM